MVLSWPFTPIAWAGHQPGGFRYHAWNRQGNADQVSGGRCIDRTLKPIHRRFLVVRKIYPRYSTALLLSRTATEEPGLARQNVALEPSSNSILNSALAS